ncbi:uncharacterized protein BX664DRAFT_318635 [Halteromyces radiatus]|uniref:uncharacterized protein n=1 Tax=Halteromyces radiatus TaxID=101107 RepID=UPI002220960A|nr:uncharacterized protein BX664DRAFT_318635 [Halteromyces radiatus]KAI8076302.1 hypothetical protein BX664DRAFT_318635 [Halteromyces radiatus]
MLNGHHYFILSFWSDEDHGVLNFVCLRAMDLVEDDQFLESFMNLVTEFCAQVVLTFAVSGLERLLRITSMTDSGALYMMQTFNDIAKVMQTFNDIAKIECLLRWNGSVRHPIEISVSNKIVLPEVQVMIVVLVMALVVIPVVVLVVVHGYYRL